MSFTPQYPPVLTETGDNTSVVLGKYNSEFQYLYVTLLSALFSTGLGHGHTGNGSDGPQLTTASLVDNAITTAKITDANVTTAKIADGAITQAKLATDVNSATAEKVNHALNVLGTAFDGSAAATVSKASEAQAEAGTDDTTLMTPHLVSLALAALGCKVEAAVLTDTGYIIFGFYIGGVHKPFTIQWGTVYLSGTATVNFPVAFANGCLGVFTQQMDAHSGSDIYDYSVTSWNSSQFTATQYRANIGNIRWFAIGC